MQLKRHNDDEVCCIFAAGVTLHRPRSRLSTLLGSSAHRAGSSPSSRSACSLARPLARCDHTCVCALLLVAAACIAPRASCYPRHSLDAEEHAVVVQSGFSRKIVKEAEYLQIELARLGVFSKVDVMIKHAGGESCMFQVPYCRRGCATHCPGCDRAC